MQAKLTRKDVAHDMDCLLLVGLVRKSVQDVYKSCQEECMDGSTQGTHVYGADRT